MQQRRFSVAYGRFVLLALAVSILAGSAFAGTEKVMYSFLGTPDGGEPQGGLVADAAGNLYGTTPYGGSLNNGTVFELSPPATAGEDWVETILYNFQGVTDAMPNGALIFDKDGNLYGTAQGANPGESSGEVFELSPPTSLGEPWTETVLWAANSSNQITGSRPLGNLVMDTAGNLYGTDFVGGVHGGGVAYELLAPTTAGGSRTKRVLHNFGAAGDGTNPEAGLLLRDGVLYGTTSVGANSVYGIVFQLTRKPGLWTEAILYTFTSATGLYPRETLIADSAGNLYGTASIGGAASNNGTVFELSPPAVAGDSWQETTLHAFTNTGDGGDPVGKLWRDNNGDLFGTTSLWGKGGGAVYKLKPPATLGGSWTYALVYVFPYSGDTSRVPSSGLTYENGALFGESDLGGTLDTGTVYSVLP